MHYNQMTTKDKIATLNAADEKLRETLEETVSLLTAFTGREQKIDFTLINQLNSVAQDLLLEYGKEMYAKEVKD